MKNLKRYSHKALKEYGAWLDGFYINCNIYEDENGKIGEVFIYV